MTRSNNDYLAILSGIRGQENNNAHYRELSGLLFGSSNRDCLQAMSSLPYGHENIKYLQDITGEYPDTSINDCLRTWASVPQSTPALGSDNMIQWIAGDNKPLACFDGSAYVTVTKTQTITDSWQCFFETKIIADPNEIASEVLYNFDTAFLFLNAAKQLKITGNGFVSTILYENIDTTLPHTVRVEMKTGGFKCTLDEEPPVEVTGTWLVTTWNTFTVGRYAPDNDRPYTGLMYYFKACSDGIETTYYPDQPHPEATITDPNNAYRKYDLLPDKSGNENYGLIYNDAGTISLNPNPSTADGVILTARGFTGYQTRTEIAALDDGTISFTALDDAALPPRSLQYYGDFLSTEEKLQAGEYVGQTVSPIPGTFIIQDGELVTQNGLFIVY